MHYTYIIQSDKDNSFYIGESKDPIQRLIKHNGQHRGYTSRKQPWNLVYVEVFLNRKLAKNREDFLKKQRNREFYLKLIDENPFMGSLPEL